MADGDSTSLNIEPQKHTQDPLAQWRKTGERQDYSWDGLTKKPWHGWATSPQDHPDGWHVIALERRHKNDAWPVPTDYSAATLQDYWRADVSTFPTAPEAIATGTTINLRSDDEMLTSGEWFRGDGQPWAEIEDEANSQPSQKFHSVHLPDRHHTTSTWKIDQTAPNADEYKNQLTKIVEQRLLAGYATADKFHYDATTLSWAPDRLADGRGQLCGALLIDFSVPEPFRQNQQSDQLPSPRPYLAATFNNSAFSGNADFSNTAFSSYADFSYTAFSDFANFSNTAFSRNANFSYTAFSDFADFSNTGFSRNANFSYTAFSGGAYFRSTAFSRNADFSYTAFSGYADFRNIAFSDFADFSNTAFSRNADFSYTAFSEFADFRNTAFLNNANFRNTAFSGNAYFRNTAFLNNANFRNTAFSGYADFKNCLFCRGAFFSAAQEKTSTQFTGSTNPAAADIIAKTRDRLVQLPKNVHRQFIGYCDFSSAQFWGRMDFTNRQFLSTTDFSDAKFHDRIKFHNADIHGDTKFTLAGFHAAPGKTPPEPDSNELLATIKKEWEKGSIPGTQTGPDTQTGIRQTIIEEAHEAISSAWTNRQSDINTRHLQRKSFDTNERRRVNTTIKGFEQDFRRLKLLMAQAQSHNDQQAFFALELKSRRMRQPRPSRFLRIITGGKFGHGLETGEVSRLEWLGSHIYERTSNFGGSLIRPIIWLVLATILFAVIYSYLGFFNQPLQDDVAQERLIAESGNKDIVLFLSADKRSLNEHVLLYYPDTKHADLPHPIADPAVKARTIARYPALAQEPFNSRRNVREAITLSATRTFLPLSRLEGKFEWWNRTVELAPFTTFSIGMLNRIIAGLLIFLLALAVRRKFQLS